MKLELNKRKNSRIGLITGIVLLLSASLVFGSTQVFAKTTVEFWQQAEAAGDPRGEAVNRIIEEFEEKNPDIQIRHMAIDLAGYLSKLIVAFTGGNPPDVAKVNAASLLSFASAGWLEPLDDLMAKSGQLDPEAWYNPTFYEWNGKTYLLPMTVNIRRIGINKNMFDEFGLTRPATWDDLLINAEKATQGDTYGWGSVLGPKIWAVNQFGNFMVMNNADIVDATAENVTISDRTFVETLEFYAELNSKYAPPGVVSMTAAALGAAFNQNRIAMFSMGNWWKQSNFDINYPDFEYNVDYASVLNPPGPERLRNLDLPRTAANMGGWAWGMSADAANPEDGWKFLEFLALPSNRARYNFAAPNSSTEVLLVPERWQTPWWDDFRESLYYGGRLFATPVPGLEEIQSVMQEQIHATILGQKSIEEAISELQTRTEEIIQKGK